MNQILIIISLIIINHNKLEADLNTTNKLLADSKGRLQSLSDASFEGILISDGKKILDANRSLLEMFGYARDEIANKNVLDFVVPEEKKRVLDKILSNFEEPYETRAIKKEGTPIPIEVHGKILPYREKMVRVTAIRNLSQWKAAQNLIKNIKS